MLGGISAGQKKELIKNVTESITRSLDIPPERVWIIINEMAFEDYGAAGLPVKEYGEKNQL